MDSIDNFRERFEALEQQTEQLQYQTRTVERRLRWWRGIACGAVLLGLVSLAHSGQAADFACAGGDVACLIDAINMANANGEENTITLEAGTYTLTAVDNTTTGPNGLPSVTGIVTIQGAGADATILERDASAPQFRLGHVAATGSLTFDGLTLRGGRADPGPGGGGIFNLGTLTIAHTTLDGNGVPGAGPGGGIVNAGGAVTIDH